MTDRSEATPYPFAYPSSQNGRKHGPEGYADYDSYRDWLRDEFCFRCVYCLRRELWSVRASQWDIDHFTPQVIDPDLVLTYDNLLYVCSSCNSIKGSRRVPDPFAIDLAAALEVESTGAIKAKSPEGQILINVLRLGNEDNTRFRAMIIRTMEILAASDRDTYCLWMGYPDDLPDLSSLRPSANAKPEGVNDSFFARRARGELEDVY